MEESPVKLGCELCPKYEPFVEFLFGNLKNLEVEAAKYQADVKDNELNDEIKKMLLKFKSGEYLYQNIFASNVHSQRKGLI